MVKRGLVILGILLILIVPLATAGIFDWFKEKVQMGPHDFNVSVGLENSPPVILEIYEVNDTEGTGQLDDQVTPLDCDASPDAVNEMVVYFKVTDPNGEDDLPGATSPTAFDIDQVSSGEDICADGNILLNITNPGTDYSLRSYYATAASCVRLASCPRSGSCTGNEMEYECTFSMNYHFEPGTWDIYLAVCDRSLTDYDDNADLDTENNTFEYTPPNNYFLITGPAGGISFTNIDTTARNQTSGNDPLVLDNCGNADMISMDIHGSNLTSDDVPGGGDDMPVEAFSVSNDTDVGGDGLEDECAGEANPDKGGDGQTADDLTETLKDIDASGDITIDYDESGDQDLTDEIYFCLWNNLNSYTLLSFDTTYSSTTEKGTTPGDPGNAWYLESTI